MQTEYIDPALLDLDQRSTADVLNLLLESQRAAVEANAKVQNQLVGAVNAAASRLRQGEGRLILAGAGASGRLAVQDGAELWPTYGWPHSRLVLQMAGGEEALLHSIEGAEDNVTDAQSQIDRVDLCGDDVIVAIAASGSSPWTVCWLRAARKCGALGIGIANNAETPLLEVADHALFLDSGNEILAGSTRMTAGTAQKIALNLFSTALMIRLNRTYGNLMVDMAAANRKLDARRLRMLKAILPDLDESSAQQALEDAGGWVKLAVLLAKKVEINKAKEMLEQANGSLRTVLASLELN